MTLLYIIFVIIGLVIIGCFVYKKLDDKYTNEIVELKETNRDLQEQNDDLQVINNQQKEDIKKKGLFIKNQKELLFKLETDNRDYEQTITIFRNGQNRDAIACSVLRTNNAFHEVNIKTYIAAFRLNLINSFNVYIKDDVMKKELLKDIKLISDDILYLEIEALVYEMNIMFDGFYQDYLTKGGLGRDKCFKPEWDDKVVDRKKVESKIMTYLTNKFKSNPLKQVKLLVGVYANALMYPIVNVHQTLGATDFDVCKSIYETSANTLWCFNGDGRLVFIHPHLAYQIEKDVSKNIIKRLGLVK